jgi:MFS transporter, DHA1 family, tetracycline resistance protein
MAFYLGLSSGPPRHDPRVHRLPVSPQPDARSGEGKRAPLLPIFLIVLVDVFGFTLVIPLLSIYAEHFQASPFEATLLVSSYAVCQLFSGPLLGRISDSVGRKPMLFVSQVGTFIGFIVMARANALWMLYLARVIDGATAGNLSLAQAYISDNTAPESRAKSFAVIGIAFGLGFFVGPAVTGYLSTFGLTAPIYCAAGLSMTSILCTLFLLPGGKPPGHSTGHAMAGGPGGTRVSVFQWGTYLQYLKRPSLARLFAQFVCFIFAFSTFTSGIALFAERRFQWHGRPFGPGEIGYLFAYTGALGIVLQGAGMGRLVKRFGEARLVTAGFLSLAVGQLFLGVVRDIGPLLVVATISSFGTGVLRPALTSLITQNAGRHEQGVVLGLNQSLQSIAQIVAPAASGLLITAGLLPEWAWMSGVAALVGLVLARSASSQAVTADLTARAPRL